MRWGGGRGWFRDKVLELEREDGVRDRSIAYLVGKNYAFPMSPMKMV